MMQRQKRSTSILVTVLVGFVSCLVGMCIAHCVWYFAVLGLVESDANAALLTGTDVIGVLEYTERYEDGYLAHVSTESFGEVTVKISVEDARDLKEGTQVQLINTIGLVELEDVGDSNEA